MAKKVNKFFVERHQSARIQRKLYQDITGKDRPHTDFLRNDSPLKDLIVAYDVSYQMDYSSPSQAMRLNNQTFRVYAIRTNNKDFEQEVLDNTIAAVQNMKASSGNGFQTGTQMMIEKNLKVDVRAEPRGLERVNDVKLTSEIVDGVARDRFYINEGKQKVKVTNKKGSTAEMSPDLIRFFRR